MTTRDELADLMEDAIYGQMTSSGVDERRNAYWLPIADTILAAFDVTPKPVDTAPPPAETFNAITDWREPVPGWETLTHKTLGSAVVTREYTVPKGQ